MTNPRRIPDDQLTPELKALRADMNAFLRHLHTFEQSPEGQRLRQQYLKGSMRRSDLADWYWDPK